MTSSINKRSYKLIYYLNCDVIYECTLRPHPHERKKHAFFEKLHIFFEKLHIFFIEMHVFFSRVDEAIVMKSDSLSGFVDSSCRRKQP